MSASCGVVVRVRNASLVAAVFSLVFASSVFAESPVDEPKAADVTAEGCRNFGTAIDWVTSPQEAARLARQESKLLMVMHLSGNFAKEAFT